MLIGHDINLDFQDVLIRPKRSTLSSRSKVLLEKKYTFANSGRTWKGVPLVASNMDAVGTFAMARALRHAGMMTCLHKHYPTAELTPFFSETPEDAGVFYTMGIRPADVAQYNQVKKRTKIGCVCIDVANGYTKHFVDFVKRFRQANPQTIVMAGNVVTPEMVSELLISGGADIIKVGLGSGSVCMTRTITGVGYPQLSAIIECADAAHGLRGHVCADGGCTCPGDVVKAFGAGADFVMLGGLLAGHDECDGQWIEEDGRRTAFRFYGMSSRIAIEKYSGGLRHYRAAEGRAVEVPYRGAVRQTLQEVTGGIRSACAYIGAESLKALPKCCTFVRVHRPYASMFQ